MDGLRGVAIALVLAYHSQWLRGGFVGVDLFFALSGFLITSLLLRERAVHGDIRLSWFWARRILRLAPALVVAVVFAIAVSSVLGLELRASWALAAVTYLANLLIAYGATYPLGLVSHMWSLAMEEQFYLFWPLVLAGLARWGVRGVCAAAGLLCVVPPLLRLAYLASHGDDPDAWLRVYFAPEMRLDALAAGCLAGGALALVPAPGASAVRAIQASTVLGVVILGAIAALADISTLVASPMLFSVTAFAATAVVVGAVRVPLFARALSIPPLVALGKISYGLYLLHVIVFNLLGDQSIVLQWAVAIVLAAASHLWIEKPFLALKRRFERTAPMDGRRAIM